MGLDGRILGTMVLDSSCGDIIPLEYISMSLFLLVDSDGLLQGHFIFCASAVLWVNLCSQPLRTL